MALIHIKSYHIIYIWWCAYYLPFGSVKVTHRLLGNFATYHYRRGGGVFNTPARNLRTIGCSDMGDVAKETLPQDNSDEYKTLL